MAAICPATGKEITHSKAARYVNRVFIFTIVYCFVLFWKNEKAALHLQNCLIQFLIF
ncbi:hypothetical protein NC99_36610 [Sunxiuqinia dokdonensis]|uniref:Uncharacterized protein n=1 Tax=Sunxiuqinia dokdonensis TaxID=1409788 RepID=A0A0L8V5U2_9BACT|nr:hypothetical protein NC99_36610 [Sunxiuqinia dokdonensis]